MAGNNTFTIIKPDAVKSGYIGEILAMMNKAGFRISGMKMLQLTRNEAESFYGVHRERPFFKDLVEFMTSGHIVVAVLEKNNAVEDFRKLIGATDPAKAADGTIRKKFASSVQANAVHGSDSDENAAIEAAFFFATSERF
jgi:nucleoside-diphosphate kinase